MMETSAEVSLSVISSGIAEEVGAFLAFNHLLSEGMDQELSYGDKHGKNRDYALLRDVEDSQQGIFDRPLPCFGCGLGWFSFLLGFVFPLLWYFATVLYFGNYYHKDPRERAGLAANAIAALIFSVVVLIVVLVILL